MPVVVGLLEARDRLPELLDRVEKGEEIAIAREGRTVARLVRSEAKALRKRKASKEELLALADRFSSLVKGPFTSADVDSILYDEDGLPK